jgi:hypothetical protein
MENQGKSCLTTLALLLAAGAGLSQSVFAQEVQSSATAPAEELVEVYFNDQTGYAKRPRVHLGAEGFVSPSQLHEVYGPHVAAGAEFESARVVEEDGFRSQAARVSVRGLHGGEGYTVGLGLGYQDLQLTPDGESREDLVRKAIVMSPQGSYSLSKNLTIGVSGRIFAENYAIRALDGIDGIRLVAIETKGDRDVNLVYGTVSTGISYHDERQEMGVVYTTDAKSRETIEETDERIQIYRAPVGTLFARGNLTEIFSVYGSVSYAAFESSSTYLEGSPFQGAQIYKRYEAWDRLGAKLSGVLWTAERSLFTISGTYIGGALQGAEGQQDSLGFVSLVNRYGVDADLTIRVQKNTSVSLLGGISRGERDESVDGFQVAQREQRSRIGTSVNMTF